MAVIFFVSPRSFFAFWLSPPDRAPRRSKRQRHAEHLLSQTKGGPKPKKPKPMNTLLFKMNQDSARMVAAEKGAQSPPFFYPETFFFRLPAPCRCRKKIAGLVMGVFWKSACALYMNKRPYLHWLDTKSKSRRSQPTIADRLCFTAKLVPAPSPSFSSGFC